MRRVFPLLVLVGPPDCRTRVLSSLEELAPGDLRDRLHMGRLVAVDELPMIQGWRDEDDLLVRHGRQRLRTDATGVVADAMLQDLLIERLELETWRRWKDDAGEETVVVGLQRGLEALASFSARFLESAAVLLAEPQPQVSPASPRVGSTVVPCAALGPGGDRRLEDAMGRLWLRFQDAHGPSSPGSVASRAPTGDFVITARDESHFKAHAREMLISREEAERAIRGALLHTAHEGEVRSAVRCDRAVGYTGLKRVRLRDDASFWARRAGRSLPSHLVEGRRRLTRWLCFWGAWRDPQTFVLHTFYPGRPAPREIHDGEISPEELKKAVAFWATHAIVVDREGP